MTLDSVALMRFSLMTATHIIDHNTIRKEKDRLLLPLDVRVYWKKSNAFILNISSWKGLRWRRRIEITSSDRTSSDVLYFIFPQIDFPWLVIVLLVRADGAG